MNDSARFWQMICASEDAQDAADADAQRYLDSLLTVVVGDVNGIDNAEAWVFSPERRTLTVSADLEDRARALFPNATFVRRTA